MKFKVMIILLNGLKIIMNKYGIKFGVLILYFALFGCSESEVNSTKEELSIKESVKLISDNPLSLSEIYGSSHIFQGDVEI